MNTCLLYTSLQKRPVTSAPQDGHISVTMNTYTHVKFQDAQEDFQKAINS